MAAPTPLRPRVPAYSLHKARGLACCKVAGKRIYLGKHGSPESHEAYAAIVARVLAGQPIPPAPREASNRSDDRSSDALITVRELATRYTQHARAYYVKGGEPTSEAGMVAKAVERTADLFGDLPADEFGPLCLEAVRDHLIELGLARNTINASVRRVRRMFKWAGSKQLIRATVFASLQLVAGLEPGRSAARETAPVGPVDDATISATLKELPSVVADMVRVQRLSGMRPGEVRTLRPIDLDRSEAIWVYTPASHKTQHQGRRRVIFIGPKAQAILWRYLERDEETCCFRPCDSEVDRRAEQHARRKTPLSCGNKPGTNRKASPTWRAGESYTKDTYNQAIRRACVRAGVEPWSANRIRHTAATEIRRLHGLEAAQVVLGHAAARTSEIYAEKNLEAAARVAELCG